jgi:hypothetical protein
MAKNEELTLRMVERDLNRMRVICDAFGGRVVKGTGDGLILIFSSAVQAVSCSLEIQRDLQRHGATLPLPQRLKHRIGVHLGDVFVRGDEVLGDGLNLAAKIQGEGNPGGVCISAPVFNVINKKITFKISPPVERKIKDLGKVIVYHISTNAPGDPVERKKRPLLYYGMAAVLVICLLLVMGAIRQKRLASLATGDSGDNKVVDEKTFIANTLEDVAQKESQLAKLPKHTVLHAVNLTFSNPAVIRTIPEKDIMASIDLFAQAGLNRIDLNPSLSVKGWSGETDEVVLFQDIAKHIHDKGMKVGLVPGIGRKGSETFGDFQTLCLSVYPIMVTDVHPDYITILDKPISVAKSLQFNVTPADWAKFVTHVANAVKSTNPGVKIIVGGASADVEILKLCLTIPEVDGISQNMGGRLKEVNSLADEVQKAGKQAMLQEAWRPNPDLPEQLRHKYGALIGAPQYEELDAKWIGMASDVAETGPFASICYNWAPPFFLYQPNTLNNLDNDYVKAAAHAASSGQTTKSYGALVEACK